MSNTSKIFILFVGINSIKKTKSPQLNQVIEEVNRMTYDERTYINDFIESFKVKQNISDSKFSDLTISKYKNCVQKSFNTTIKEYHLEPQTIRPSYKEVALLIAKENTVKPKLSMTMTSSLKK